MKWWKKGNALLIVLIAGIFYLCGCGYQKSSSIQEKPPDYRGHGEDQPETRYEHMHQQRESKVSHEKSEPNRVSSTTTMGYGVVSIEKNAPAEIQVGKLFNYTIKITNLISQKVKDVEITETFSHKYKLRGALPKTEKEKEGSTATWFIGDLNPHETKTIRVTGLSLETGEMPFCTDVKYNLPPLCLLTNVVEPKLTIAKRAPSEVLLCDTIPITLVVSNTGTGAAQNIQVRESLPPGMKTLEGNSEISQEIGTLKPGESREIALTIKAERTGKFNNVATLTAEGGLQAASNTTTTVKTTGTCDYENRSKKDLYRPRYYLYYRRNQ